jgi:hypothetical protein
MKFQIGDFIRYIIKPNYILEITNMTNNVYTYNVYNIKFEFIDHNNGHTCNIDRNYEKINEQDLIKLKIGAL